MALKDWKKDNARKIGLLFYISWIRKDKSIKIEISNNHGDAFDETYKLFVRKLEPNEFLGRNNYEIVEREEFAWKAAALKFAKEYMRTH